MLPKGMAPSSPSALMMPWSLPGDPAAGPGHWCLSGDLTPPGPARAAASARTQMTVAPASSSIAASSLSTTPGLLAEDESSPDWRLAAFSIPYEVSWNRPLGPPQNATTTTISTRITADTLNPQSPPPLSRPSSDDGLTAGSWLVQSPQPTTAKPTTVDTTVGLAGTVTLGRTSKVSPHPQAPAARAPSASEPPNDPPRVDGPPAAEHKPSTDAADAAASSKDAAIDIEATTRQLREAREARHRLRQEAVVQESARKAEELRQLRTEAKMKAAAAELSVAESVQVEARTLSRLTRMQANAPPTATAAAAAVSASSGVLPSAMCESQLTPGALDSGTVSPTAGRMEATGVTLPADSVMPTNLESKFGAVAEAQVEAVEVPAATLAPVAVAPPPPASMTAGDSDIWQWAGATATPAALGPAPQGAAATPAPASVSRRNMGPPLRVPIATAATKGGLQQSALKSAVKQRLAATPPMVAAMPAGSAVQGAAATPAPASVSRRNKGPPLRVPIACGLQQAVQTPAAQKRPVATPAVVAARPAPTPLSRQNMGQPRRVAIALRGADGAQADTAGSAAEAPRTP
ncbi:hypothetical protein PLESTB_001177500 [Pleodorina starrii]|uniref:Uncharacterized protein n=1 Tax=Pleodorina starrii TaxID=330485 RepID=A0A9W6BSR2_9CHLO|nr:hypothetical protein PLESTB_001177500 [Pleodorina starrii]